jgi:hypothetical protein
MLLRIVDLEFLKVRVAVQKFLMIRDAVVIDPVTGTNKAVRKPAHVSLPIANKEVEVVRSIACGSRRGRVASARQRECKLQNCEEVKCTRSHRKGVEPISSKDRGYVTTLKGRGRLSAFLSIVKINPCLNLVAVDETRFLLRLSELLARLISPATLS